MPFHPAKHELASRWRSPAAWVRALRLVLLIGVMVLGQGPVWTSAWVSLARSTGQPVEELPADSSEPAAESYYAHSQRCQRTLRGDLARAKLPPNHLAAHFAHGRGFLMAESCFGSEHALRNGTGSHLRC